MDKILAKVLHHVRAHEPDEAIELLNAATTLRTGEIEQLRRDLADARVVLNRVEKDRDDLRAALSGKEKAEPIGTLKRNADESLTFTPIGDPYVINGMELFAAAESQDQTSSSGSEVDKWAPYLKEGEAPFERFQRERKDLEGCLSLLAKEREESARLADLVDAQKVGHKVGEPWIDFSSGIARVHQATITDLLDESGSAPTGVTAEPTFEQLCEALPADTNWGDELTPAVAKEIFCAGASSVGVTADAEDARKVRRYDWLRECRNGNALYALVSGGYCGGNLDVSIDAAIAAEEAKGK